jgi:glucose/mannose-6-phosphate isomerase
MFVSLLGVLRAFGATDELEGDLDEAVDVLQAQERKLAPSVPLVENAAMQLAMELAGRVPVVIGAGPLAPVARRWKTQFNENSKSWGFFEELPEMNHNALSGIHFPADMAGHIRVLLLSNRHLHPRTRLRLALTRQILGDAGIACQRVPVPGTAPLAQILGAVQMGDYVSCYRALLDGADPTDIADIASLKQSMAAR